MKKILIISLILVVIFAGAVAGVFLLRKKPATIEDILPADALFYVKLSDVENNLTVIKSTAFWQALETVNWDYLLQKSLLSPDQKEFITSVGQKLSEPSTKLLLREFFGQEFAVAFYAPPTDTGEVAILPDKDMYSFVSKMFSKVLLVTHVQGKGVFVDFLSNILGRLNGELHLETVEVEGLKVHRVKLPEADVWLSFVNIEDFLVIGFNEEIVEQSIKAFRKQSGALASQQSFQKSRQHAIEPAELSGYWNLAAISSYTNDYLGAFIDRMEAQIRYSPEQARESMRQNADTVKTWLKERSRLGAGLDVLGISGQWDELLTLKFNLYFNKDKLEPNRAALYNCPAAANKTLTFIPADVLGYQWNNCLDASLSWEEIKREVAGIKQPSDEAVSPVTAIENILDINVQEDVLPALGDEVGGYLKDIRMAGRLPVGGSLFPVPDILFFIKSKDDEKTRQLLAKLTSRFIDFIRTEEYKGIALQYIVSPLGGDIELAYCILDQYVLFSLNRSLLKESIDIHHNGSSSLAGSAEFQEGNFPVAEKSRSIQFIRIAPFAGKVAAVWSWAKTRLAAQDAQKEAFQAGSAQRLTDVIKETLSKKEELEKTRKEIPILEKILAEGSVQNPDFIVQQNELNALRERTQILEEEIAAMYKQQGELEEIRSGYDRYVESRKQREELDQNIIAPLLKSFAFLKTWRLRTTLENDAFESRVWLKVE